LTNTAGLNGVYVLTYIVTYEDGDGYTTASLTAQVQAVAHPIPEFATVAIPIAAVLGLVFFFQQRKIKKE